MGKLGKCDESLGTGVLGGLGGSGKGKSGTSWVQFNWEVVELPPPLAFGAPSWLPNLRSLP